MKHDFTLTFRPSSQGQKIYYMYFYDGDRRKCMSTGKTRKYEAEAFAREYLKKLHGDLRKGLSFQAFSEGFFDWTSSPWVKRQHAKNRPLSKFMAAMRDGHLRNYLLPAFGAKQLPDINAVAIEDWLVSIKRANATKKHILGTLRIILGEAEREGLIPFNPVLKVESLGKNPKKRDAFTRDEIAKFFPSELDRLTDIWGNLEYASAFFILASTGIRSGELRALQWRHVHPEGYIEIVQALKADNSLGTTKTGRERIALLVPRARELLSLWWEETEYKAPDDFVFHGIDGGHTFGRRTLLSAFGKALTKAGIATEGRNLVVHSFRHTFNTFLKPIVPLATLQSLTGHSTLEMSEQYNHPNAEDTFQALKHTLPQIETVYRSVN